MAEWLRCWSRRAWRRAPPPTLSGSQQQRLMEHRSQVILEVAKTTRPTILYAVQEEDEKRNEC
ncbi:hypothetical protein KIN20_019681 [Parelaphostrongylus tenuis]|uniref:Uncharacterized protein n=1 Tax=Parelaphostrongylus tenuis TaxID=148309 RepID=A0AAD5N3D1_PARTN|nr:hypothetical protein KIN20_019681 [Parelaphostrongylus tenuis]